MRYLISDIFAADCRNQIKRCDICIEDGKICELAPPGLGKGVLIFDGKGQCAALPGLVNAHTHAAMTLLRGIAEELPLMQWLGEKIWPAERRLDDHAVYSGTCLAALEMLSCGVTCFNDMYFNMDKVADAALDTGMRAALCTGILNEETYDIDKWLALSRRFEGHSMIKAHIGPHAPYTVCETQLKAMAAVAVEHNLPVHVHWLETQWEAGYFKDELKCNPVDLLQRTGLLNVPSLIIAHGVYFAKEDIPRLALPNVTVVHNPSSNMKLGSGVAPIPFMLENGVNVALGTDGAASNNRLDMWAEMRLAALLHKGVNNDPTAVKASQVLEMATLKGARALGFDNLGLIEEGYEADIMAVNLNAPHYIGWDETNLLSFIVYAGSSRDVKTTFVAGKKLYENGEFPHCDAKKIIKEANGARERILKC